MIIYLIIASIGIIAFWSYYKLALKSFTQFNLIRFYFLLAIAVSVMIPMLNEIKIEVPNQISLEQEPIVSSIDALVVSEITTIKNEVKSFSSNKNQVQGWVYILYFGVCALFLVKVLYSIIKIAAIKKSSESETIDGIRFYYNDKIYQPFSLLKSIYLPKHWKGQTPAEVIDHELVHINQNHFIDLFLLEILTVLLWFNPFVYLFKKEVRLNLEYLADDTVINKGQNVCHYQSLLLSIATNGVYQTPLNLYFNISLKNRITMMSKKKTGQLRKIALLGVLPITLALTALKTSHEMTSPIREVIKHLGLITQVNEPSLSPLDENDTIKVTSGYGMKMHPIYKVEKMHNGIDIKAKEGTPVYATANGTIEIAEFDEAHGNYVQIKHSDTYQSRYSHLKKFTVTSSSTVKKGDVIGYVGNTGVSTAAHLHYEVHKNGEPVDPAPYLNIEIE